MVRELHRLQYSGEIQFVASNHRHHHLEVTLPAFLPPAHPPTPNPVTDASAPTPMDVAHDGDREGEKENEEEERVGVNELVERLADKALGIEQTRWGKEARQACRAESRPLCSSTASLLSTPAFLGAVRVCPLADDACVWMCGSVTKVEKAYGVLRATAGVDEEEQEDKVHGI